MAASIEQKVDYLLKKIGYTASKTGIAEDSSLSGTKKAPFAEALPSPLVVPATSIYGQSESIPSTPPGTTSGVVEVYGTATAFQMTEDNTVSGQRAWLARSVQGNNTSPMVGDWIDTQFGSDYIVQVYAGDPNSGGTKLSAAGSGSNDTWFFDYASGVLNFNGDAAPTAVTGGADIYLVGYRYTGTKGATGAGGNFTNAVVGVLTVTGTITAQSDIIGDGASNITGFNSITAASYYLQDGSDVPQNVFTVSGTDVSLNGVDAIDATTKATLEASLSIAPNEFSDIVVSGLSTFNGNIDLNADIEGNGSNVVTGLGSMTVGILTATKATLGTGSTITGIGYIEQLSVADPSTFASDLTVNGVLTADSLQVNNPLENVVITDVNITGDALVGGALTVAGGITGNLTGDVVGTASSANQVLVTPELSSSTVHYINFSEQSIDPTDLHRDSTLTYTPSTDTLAATNVSATTLTASGEVEGGSLDINGAGDISGNLDVGGNLTVAGTLTYEDVTDIDSVGLITARSGIHVLAGGIDVQAGVVTSADGFAGDLTGNVTGNVTGNLTGEVNAAAFDTNADGTVTTGIATATGFSGPLVGDVTGNADSADQVKTQVDDTNASQYLTFVDSNNIAAGNESLKTDGQLTFNPNTNVLTLDGTVSTEFLTLNSINVTSTATELNYLDGSTPGSATAGNAVVVDNDRNITNLGVVTASAFVGDGSGLTNINQSINGQDISVRNAQVGGALTVTGATTAADITSSGTVDAATFSVSGTNVLETVNGQVSLSGIATLDATTKATIEREIALAPNDFNSLNVTGVGTFAGKLNANGGLEVVGHSELDDLNVSGVSTFNGVSNFEASTNFNQGTVTIANIGSFDTLGEAPNAQFDINVTFDDGLTVSADTLTRIDGDLDVDGLSELDDVNIAGVATGTQFNIGNTAVLETVNGQVSLSGIATLDATTKATIEREIALAPNDFASLNVSGVGTVNGQFNAKGGLDVTGHSELDDLNVSGVATVTGALDANGGAALSGGVTADELTVVGFTTVGGDLLANSNLDVTDQTTLNTLRATGVATFVSSVQVDGNLTANGDIIGDGATDISGIASVTATEFYGDGSNLTGLEAGLDGLDVTLGDVTVGGGLTVTGATDLNGDLDVDGHAELDELRVSGVSTFVSGVTFEENLAILGQGSIQTLVVVGNSSLQDAQVGGGLTVTGATDLNGALDVQGNTNLQGDLGVGGTSNFSDLASFQDNIKANASLDVADNFTVSNIFSVSSAGETQEFAVTGVTGEFNDGIRVDGSVSGNAGIVTTGDLAGAVTGLDIAPRHINASGIITAAGAIDANGGLDVAGGATLDTLTVTGNSTLGDASSDTVSFVASVGTGLTPSADSTHDLGSNALRFKDAYANNFIGSSIDVDGDVSIGGNLSVGGTVTAVDIVDLQIISPVVELGLESVGDGTLQPPAEQTLYSSGIAMWYNRTGVSSENAQAAAMFADVKPSGSYRIGFATDVSIAGYGTTDSIESINGWAEIEAAGLWMNDCAGQSVVINCTGTERFLNNITVDGGTF